MDKRLFALYKDPDIYDLWPILEEKFFDIVYGINDANNETKVFLEIHDGEIIGYLSAKYKIVASEKKGAIVIVFVAPQYRKKGIGYKLVKLALEWFAQKGVEKIVCGGGAGSYFWPAVPENLKCIGFFEKCGFSLSKDNPVDMYAEITSYQTPVGTFEKVKDQGVEIQYSSEEWSESIMQFVEKNFINWKDYYAQALQSKRYKNVFFAHKGQEIVAVSLLWKENCLWRALFENNVGGGGSLGVSEKWQGKGIGLAMKAWGTEILQTAGVKYVYIGWTHAVHFYEKLGFTIWRKYLTAKIKNNKN